MTTASSQAKTELSFALYFKAISLASGDSRRKNPVGTDEMASISIWNPFQIILMLRFGLPEFPCRHNLRYGLGRPKSRGVDICNGLFSNPLLFVAGKEDRGAITVAEIVSLPVQGCWVMDLEEEFQELAVRDFERIEDDFDGLGMTRMVAIGGIRDVTARVSDPRGNYAGVSTQQILHPPEAAAG